jgi:hypothetical protein
MTSTNEEDKVCWCEDPANVGHKLFLCGSALCHRLLNKKVPLPRLIRFNEEEESK